MTTVDIARQVQGICQAILLGGALGVVYDLMRVARRLSLPVLAGVLDFLFWVVATAALFFFSHSAWDGEIRLYGAVFCMLGGAAYFWGISPVVLRVSFAAVEVLRRVLGILTAPARLLGRLFKRIGKNVKNIFSFLRKRSMISLKPKA